MRGRGEAEKEGLKAAAAAAEERHAVVLATVARHEQELQNYKAHSLYPLSLFADRITDTDRQDNQTGRCRSQPLFKVGTLKERHGTSMP